MEDARKHEILVGAINVLEKHGWIKGASRGPNGFCMTGAMCHAADQLGIKPGKERLRLLTACRKQVSAVIHRGALQNYNDEAGTRKVDIIQALSKAAESCAPEPDTEFLNESEDQSRTIADRTDDRTATLTRA